jgi:hypothetical protein
VLITECLRTIVANRSMLDNFFIINQKSELFLQDLLFDYA